MSTLETILGILVPVQFAVGVLLLIALIVNASRLSDIARHLNDIDTSLADLAWWGTFSMRRRLAAGCLSDAADFTDQDSATVGPDCDTSGFTGGRDHPMERG